MADPFASLPVAHDIAIAIERLALAWADLTALVDDIAGGRGESPHELDMAVADVDAAEVSLIRLLADKAGATVPIWDRDRGGLRRALLDRMHANAANALDDEPSAPALQAAE